ncbi:MAG TPA: nuclear transport factor 2 family protein [Pyrinomonadaceae bacterium]|nr:nuclear transport factor 2 family protein [Pyrinomonadaceae bacterium]
MKRMSKGLAPPGAEGFSLRASILLLVCLLSAGSAHAQAGKDAKSPQELYDRIAALDAALFDAYNRCDIDKVGTLFTEDLEFYHEKGGLTLTRDATLSTMRKNLCAGGGYHLRRELVQGGMEVRPIGDYGAVQTGEHRFYLTQKGRKETLDGVCKFVMIWRKTGDEWRISRVISYGCRAPN